MSWFTDLFTGGAGSIINAIADTADKFITTDEEKQEFQLKVQAAVQARMTEIETTARTELEAKQNLLVAELQQGDSYTKRARPTVVYFGLIIIFYNYCFVPTLSLLLADTVTPLELPTEFWVAWGGIVSSWVIGRSAEKRGSMNRLTSLITGTEKGKSLLD